MDRFFTSIFILSILLVSSASAQTQKDTIYTNFSKIPVVIDGSDADACWAKATWHAIDQVWIPYNAVMDDGDFEGKYKVAWDANYLYILVEVKDNMLSDDHTNPTDNYWNDDCVEIFIDEDRSKGNHERNNNAFAYHVSVFYDAIDGGMGTTVNYKQNLTVKMDTIGEDTYLWEFAVKMFNSSFNGNNFETSRVKLTPNKLMGFSIAYCDNDETTSRENFIGSMIMPEAHANDNYITADYFGSMLLIDPDQAWTSNTLLPANEKKVSVYPNPATDQITISEISEHGNAMKLEIRSITGSIIRTVQLSGLQETVEIGDLAKGIYLFNLLSDSFSQTERIVKR
jgi:hypothetical protein